MLRRGHGEAVVIYRLGNYIIIGQLIFLADGGY
ncbi:MAG: hypothetical protein DDT30_00353 [Dehalococcoidia bacterium]|nr:hypothetical protein [Bacillota bacterium]